MKCDGNTEGTGRGSEQGNRGEEETGPEEGLEGFGNVDVVRAGTKHLNLHQHLVKSSFKVCSVSFL